jgi:hypothetical protein
METTPQKPQVPSSRQPYETPHVRKHSTLKDVTLFTNFGPPGSKEQPAPPTYPQSI